VKSNTSIEPTLKTCGKPAAVVAKFVNPKSLAPAQSAAEIPICESCTAETREGHRHRRQYFGRSINPETEADLTCKAIVFTEAAA
jgi:hypothetical protein